MSNKSKYCEWFMSHRHTHCALPILPIAFVIFCVCAKRVIQFLISVCNFAFSRRFPKFCRSKLWVCLRFPISKVFEKFLNSFSFFVWLHPSCTTVKKIYFRETSATSSCNCLVGRKSFFYQLLNFASARKSEKF